MSLGSRVAQLVAASAAAFYASGQFVSDNSMRILAAVVVAAMAVYLTRPAAPAPPVERLTRAHELHIAGVGGKPAGMTGVESVAEVKDFTITGSTPIDFLAIFKERPKDITPYTLDVERGCIIFVEIDADVLANSKAPFIYQAQRNEARKVYAVPYDEAVAAMNELDKDKTWGSLSQVMFVHSTGRCGSTLFSKVMGNLASVTSLSEPDIFSMAFAERKLRPTMLSEAECATILRVGTFFHTYSALKHKAMDVVVFKTRSFFIEIGDLLKKAVPESKTVFLYRNAMDVIDSYCMAFYNHFVGRLARRFGLDSFAIFHSGNLHTIFPVIAPLMADTAYPKETYQSIGAVGLFTMGWLSCMDSAVRLNDAKVLDAVFRYEELTTQKVGLAKKVLKACGFNSTLAEDEATMAKVFEADAHGEDSRTTSARRAAKVEGPMYIRAEDFDKVRSLIAVHPTIKTGDFVIPGTLL